MPCFNAVRWRSTSGSVKPASVMDIVGSIPTAATGYAEYLPVPLGSKLPSGCQNWINSAHGDLRLSGKVGGCKPQLSRFDSDIRLARKFTE